MAIYTLVNNSQLKSLLAYYDIGELVDYTPIQAGTTNSNYDVIVEYKHELYRYVLTIIEQKLLKSELTFCLEFASLLDTYGLPAANPIKDRHGLSYRIFLDKPIIITPYLPGANLQHDIDVLDKHHCGYMGLAVGNMHLVGTQVKLQRKNPANFDWCLQTWTNIKNSVPEEYKALVNDEIKYLTHEYILLTDCSLAQGAIHADLFMDNVLFTHHKLEGIIDFYYACTDYFLYDLAIVVNDWVLDNQGIINEANYSALVSNYFAALKKDATLYDNLLENSQKYPTIWNYFLRLAALRFLLLRLKAQYLPIDSHLKTIKDPNEFKLKLSFHQKNMLQLITDVTKL